ncbi:MAG: alpha/beta fold hydrolase, partial [Burkholderiales bacterium]
MVFNEYEQTEIDTGLVKIRARIGGHGPPLLLLHGNPQTHLMWHAIAGTLAQRFTVVATDLTGYGRSSKPPSTADHVHYSKRSMARDQIAVMKTLGHSRFMVAGHDRGGRVGYRMALDAPEVVTRLAVLDVIPTAESFAHGGREFGMGYYHWFFLAQPAPLPERLIGADPEWFWRWHTARGQGEIFAPEAIADYLSCFQDPETIRAICEDYRAGASIDCDHDETDRKSGRRITCP